MLMGQKIRLCPTKEQEILLWQSAGTARWAYNWALKRQKENYEAGGTFLSDGTLRKEITQLKQTEEFVWLKNISNNIPKQAIKDACEAYKRFFKKLAGFPRFKSRKRSTPKFYHDCEKLKVRPDKFVWLEKIGWVRASEQILPGPYCNPRISYDGKYWYLAVVVDKLKIQGPMPFNVMGVDVGIKDLAICSDGAKYTNINKSTSVKKLEKRLKRQQRQVSHKYEMNKKGTTFNKTENIQKAEVKLRHLHRKLTNIRTNHLHQTSNAIVKTKPCKVVMEDLNVSGMMRNRHLAQAIQQQKLAEFATMMQYKCEKNNILFEKVDRYFPSSKICSCCGVIKKELKLSERNYHCSCGNHMDRDVNAAINLANEGIKTMVLSL
jgi:putative transposase